MVRRPNTGRRGGRPFPDQVVGEIADSQNNSASRLADRLEVDPATASQAYYACLLSNVGCSTDAHVTAGLFGASLTTHLNPVLYGSQREVLTGLIRALPEPASPTPVRALQVARGFPRLVRVQRPHFTAMCEVARCWPTGSDCPPRSRVCSPCSARRARRARTKRKRQHGGRDDGRQPEARRTSTTGSASDSACNGPAGILHVRRSQPERRLASE